MSPNEIVLEHCMLPRWLAGFQVNWQGWVPFAEMH